MNAKTNAAASHKVTAASHQGPLDWRHLVQWLQQDAVISLPEAKRTVDRCSKAESAQHPLVRLASVAITRASDGKPLDMEDLTQFLANKAGVDYFRIDPMKVDVSKVAETMSASYAERHGILPVQVLPSVVVIATSQPFVSDWVDEVERQAKRSVRIVVASPQDIHKLPWPNPCATPSKLAVPQVARVLSNWSNSVRVISNSMRTTKAWCRWWIGCGNTLLTNARVIFTSSRAVSKA
jgi:hypothetical protein